MSLSGDRFRSRLAGALLVMSGFAAGIVPRAAGADDGLVARGREVYIAEGCINCHSQYVRAGMPEEVRWWGPARPKPDTLAETPPLLGLRRQGPDLMNVGNRRSGEWQRLHLLAPRSLVPGSRMPSYAHLFQPGTDRGAALVAYLGELGAGTLAARQEQAVAWTPAAATLATPFAAPTARRLFGQLCAACHGADGRGDGPLAGQLSLRPPDFARDAWRHVAADDSRRTAAVARIIKFGLPGSPMAGHEYLEDTAVILLAREVEALHR